MCKSAGSRGAAMTRFHSWQKCFLYSWIINVGFNETGNLVRTKERVETKDVGNEEPSGKPNWEEVEEHLGPSWAHLRKK